MTKYALVAVLSAVVICSFMLKKKHDLDLVFIGDSITLGSAPKIQYPPKWAGEYLQQQRHIGNVQVVNMGKSGFTTVNFLPGHDTFAELTNAVDAVYVDKSAELVFSIMLGTNDSAIKGPAGAPVSASDYRANLRIIVDSLLARYPSCKIVIHHPIWYSELTHNTGASYLKEGQARVLQYHKEIDDLAAGYAKTSPLRVFLGDTVAYAYFKTNYLTEFKHQAGPDGIYFLHPNEHGDSTLGVYWARAILHVL